MPPKLRVTSKTPNEIYHLSSFSDISWYEINYIWLRGMPNFFFYIFYFFLCNLVFNEIYFPKTSPSPIFTSTPHKQIYSHTTHITLTYIIFEVSVLIINQRKSVEVCRHVKLLIANNCYFFNNSYIVTWKFLSKAFIHQKHSHFWHFEPATLLKLTLLHGCFARFLNCTNCTKSLKASHM